MDLETLKTRITAFQDVLTACARWRKADSRVAWALSELYAARSANELLLSASALFPNRVEDARKTVNTEHESYTVSTLPSPETVRDGVPRLLSSVTAESPSDTVNALKEMGVLKLCPPPEQLFDRLAFVVGGVIGRARLVPLLELATFAAEQRAYNRAGQFLAEARTLGPGPMEQHCLFTVEGILHLESKDILKAKECLLDSIRVCREHSDFVRTGIFGFHVMLAERLLEQGERQTVVNYLTECAHVWSHEKELIGLWISAVNAGEKPEFLKSSFLAAVHNPVIKLRTLTSRSSCIDDTTTPSTTSRKSRAERLAEFQRRTRAAMRGELDSPKN
jgi:hypothetical protein